MKLRRLLLAAILAFGLTNPVQSTVLKGGVEHSDSLKPIESSLAPGQVYDPNNLPMVGAVETNRWYRIPDWLAGTWHKESQTDYFRYDYATRVTDTTTRTAPARSDGRWGTQMDEKGAVWQYDPTPFTAKVDSGDEYVVQLVRVSEPVEATDKVFVRRSVDTQIRIEKATNRIKSVESGEQITQYVPEGEQLVKRETSAKVFDDDGRPVLLGKSFAYENRIAPFQAQDTYQGKDMRVLFKKFLQSQNETAFLPTK
jgi:hypothetical protein